VQKGDKIEDFIKYITVLKDVAIGLLTKYPDNEIYVKLNII
jgi:hypothetical protein